MASSSPAANKCARCIQTSNEDKAKPGIVPCVGCQQAFCLPHFVEHRQTLSDTLDVISAQRDDLRSRISELSTKMPKEHLKVIDDWEQEMLQTVTAAAINARQQVQQLITSELERECDELTGKIASFRQNDDYFEGNLQELRAKTQQLDDELTDLSVFHRIQLTLPTLDCSNIVKIKPSDTHSLSEREEDEENKDVIDANPKREYHSFVEQFLATHQPSTNVQTHIYGNVCASPTMLIAIANRHVTRLVFYRQSTSEFEWKHGNALKVQWSSQLQQFIALTADKIVAIDPVEKDSGVVTPGINGQLQHMACWKHLCVIADNRNRVLLYRMNKNLSDWFLLYCWSPPTSCALYENITAVGLNERHIALAIERDIQYHFVLYNYQMIRSSTIRLLHPCTSIQALPKGEWLLYDSTEHFYNVIDAELERQDEAYLSSLEDSRFIVTCDDNDKVLLVLLPEQKDEWIRDCKARIYDCQL